MLSNKLHVFYQRVNDAVAVHGLNPKVIADIVISEAFPDTSASAAHEGADTMLRNGVIDFLSQHFKNSPSHHPLQSELEFSEEVRPLVAKLKGQAQYVQKLGRYIPNALLFKNKDWLDDARRYKRQKGEETLAEAVVLDEIFNVLYPVK